MHGPTILARFLAEPGPADKYGNEWQYNSRSDRHSKVGCWGIAFDLLLSSNLLRRHVEEGKVALGVNHEMRDFATSRKKDLDLVIARPAGSVTANHRSLRSLSDSYGIVLSREERSVLDGLPDFPVAPVGAVLVALEAKATMTAHIKALPRLYDELNSSHQCVHGASAQALAIGYVQVNAADRFASSVTNNLPLDQFPIRYTPHRQPRDTERVISKVRELPRRTRQSDHGFDGLGITVLSFENDGGPVEIVTDPPAPNRGESDNYDRMIERMATEYDTRFLAV
ncbi:hypothetical protein GCG21_02855 [Pseudactinotalea sp. HY160]|uniref:hypothetical protein n=1 Tax=Pseudactinotalea sp. HY160 TaxID=2654490 RepID=UPI00128B830B|nr:hypothetical protein [Pseudactinotalea sp. HY160]MPV48966.1 hypothetical protein [Pseudactinotalea sp. HY160]